eukprot:TRINITY_DN9957_c0_g1_i1.p1 TRINITY_DN9957_c0_g1~~TRINITY_DN9957_c0_g1_i1.p1  ORF type:complete len:508 (+),score=60.36 TRINITY_DN9957_c0_g1_i1:1741-3264(+)
MQAAEFTCQFFDFALSTITNHDGCKLISLPRRPKMSTGSSNSSNTAASYARITLLAFLGMGLLVALTTKSQWFKDAIPTRRTAVETWAVEEHYVPSKLYGAALPVNVDPTQPLAITKAGSLSSMNIKKLGYVTDPDAMRQLSSLRDQPCQIDWSVVVDRQLANWRETGITQEQVAQHCNRKAVRVSIIDAEIRHMAWQVPAYNLHRVVCVFWLIQTAVNLAIIEGNPIPNVELALQPEDGAFSTAKLQWPNAGPLFSNVKCGGDASVSVPMTLHDQFGMPDGRMSMKLYELHYRQLVEWGSRDWEAKQAKAFFSAGHSAVTRGNRSHLFNFSSPVIKTLEHNVPLSEYGRYRYLIYAYGHCGWSRRLHELAFMKAGVLMEQSTCREYLHDLFPTEDYVSIQEDFSDVLQVVERLQSDSEASRQMADRWHKRGIESFRLICVLKYMQELLRRYASLQRFTPDRHHDWPIYTLGDDCDHFSKHGRNGSAADCPKVPFDPKHPLPRSHAC